MSRKSLIVGMGFGQAVYLPVLRSLGHEVITVDNTLPADYSSLEAALAAHTSFDTAHICVPNFLHQPMAEQLLGKVEIIFVEKPGFKTARDWQHVWENRQGSNLYMVKNNQYRTDLPSQAEIANCDQIDLIWKTRDRVPSPGSWFTNKELSFGGVSRDIVPHLLSLALKFSDQQPLSLVDSTLKRQYSLQDFKSTEYGTVNLKGKYNVDDMAHLLLESPYHDYQIHANWKTNAEEFIGIRLLKNREIVAEHALGLCPESAYQEMIITCLDEAGNQEFWQHNFEQDIRIHNILDAL